MYFQIDQQFPGCDDFTKGDVQVDNHTLLATPPPLEGTSKLSTTRPDSGSLCQLATVRQHTTFEATVAVCGRNLDQQRCTWNLREVRVSTGG